MDPDKDEHIFKNPTISGLFMYNEIQVDTWENINIIFKIVDVKYRWDEWQQM